MNIVFVLWRESLIRLNTVESPINSVRNHTLNFEIKDFPFEPGWCVEPFEHVGFGKDCLCDGTFAVNVCWDIKDVSHLELKKIESCERR